MLTFLDPHKLKRAKLLRDLTILLVSHSQDHLWGSVVSSHHIRGHHEAGASGPSQTKVQDFQGAIWLHHYIAWLEVLKQEKKRLI